MHLSGHKVIGKYHATWSSKQEHLKLVILIQTAPHIIYMYMAHQESIIKCKKLLAFLLWNPGHIHCYSKV